MHSSKGGGVGSVWGGRNCLLSPRAAIWGGHSHVLSEDWGIMRKFFLWLFLNFIFWSTLATVACWGFLFSDLIRNTHKKYIKALRLGVVTYDASRQFYGIWKCTVSKTNTVHVEGSITPINLVHKTSWQERSVAFSFQLKLRIYTLCKGKQNFVRAALYAVRFVFYKNHTILINLSCFRRAKISVVMCPA